MEFSYHRHASGLRALMTSLAAVVAVDAAIFVALVVLLSPPWNLIAACLGLLYAIHAVTRVLRTKHRVLRDRLLLAFGRFRLEIPRENLRSAGLLPSVPSSVAAAAQAWPAYRPEEGTLYVVPHQKGPVELKLVAPQTARLCRFSPPVEFSRVVLAVDEPQTFLEAVGCPGADGASPPQLPEDRAPSLDAERRAGLAAVRETPADPLQDKPAGEAAILLEHLTKRYGDFTAVNEVSLSVQPGEILAFLGSNGAGKSTTIRMMTGVLRPTAGRVLVYGRDVWHDGAQARRLIGYVPDTPLLYESLTAQEFLWFIGGLYDLHPREARARAEELLEMLQMTRWRDDLIRGFSLGMRRKMSIAAALMHRPRVLLLDEVTNGLDPRSARVVKDLILEQAREGVAVFLTTHILDVANELAHRFAFIDRGQVLAVGTRDEIERLLGRPCSNLEELFLALTEDAPERSGTR